MNNNKIPTKVEAQIIQFSNSLRAINYSGDNPSILLYRNIIRDNIHEILNKTFPLLSKELNTERKKIIVDNFILKHSANEAEFHKIATELICFIKTSNYLEDRLLCLIEYEWILYHIEISECLEKTQTKEQYLPPEISKMKLKLNPTLKFIKLPFLIQDGIPIMNQSGDYIYGLFKNSANEILRKRLFSFDLSILNYIVDKSIDLISDIEELTPKENKEYLQKWIIENITEEFISLN